MAQKVAQLESVATLTLTKTNYIAGLQCPKLLWHVVNAPEELADRNAGSEANFVQGYEIGLLARALFPEGLLIDGMDRDRSLSHTSSAMSCGVPIFEAAFRHDAGFTRVDILVPVEAGEWDVLEVKSSTKPKSVHLDDLAFQAQVLTGAGIKVRKLWLVLINGAHIRDGTIRPGELFVHVDVTDDVWARAGSVERRLLQWSRMSLPRTHLSGLLECNVTIHILVRSRIAAGLICLRTM